MAWRPYLIDGMGEIFQLQLAPELLLLLLLLLLREFLYNLSSRRVVVHSVSTTTTTTLIIVHHSCHPHHRRYCTKPSPVVSHQRLYSATFLRTRRGEKKHRQRNTLTRLRRGCHEAQRRGGGGGRRGGIGCYEISFNPLVPSLALLPAVVAPFSPVWPCLNGVRPWKI